MRLVVGRRSGLRDDGIGVWWLERICCSVALCERSRETISLAGKAASPCLRVVDRVGDVKYWSFHEA